MSPTKHHRHQLEVTSNLDSLDTTRSEFRAYLSKCGADTVAKERWTLVFTEALVNAIKHNDAPDQPIKVEWWQDTDAREIILEVENIGKGPTEDQAENASLPDDELSDSGRGLYLIKELADRTEHWRCGSRYRIVIGCTHEALVRDQGIDGDLEMALEELENNYEHLAAFHALGNAIINNRPPSDVIREGLVSLAGAQNSAPELIKIGISSEAIVPELASELLTIPEVVEPWALPGSAAELLHGGATLLWGAEDGIDKDPDLSPYRTGCCLPIVAGGTTLGVLLVGRKDGRADLPSSEIGRYQTFADLFAITLANAGLQLVRDRQKRDLRDFEIATEIQKAVLNIPAAPTSENWELFLQRRSAKDVAGDYVEAVLDSEGRIVMSIVDVMGKGVPAAILASMFRTALQSHLQRNVELPELIESINSTLCRQIGNMTMFLTCLIARLDPETGELEIVNAGHCPLIIMRASGGSEEISPTGSPLGLFVDDTYPAEHRSFYPGDSLLMVTDGLYEWERDGQPWGWDSLADLALAERNCGRSLWNRLQQKITDSGQQAAPDDQTLLHFKLLENQSALETSFGDKLEFVTSPAI